MPSLNPRPRALPLLIAVLLAPWAAQAEQSPYYAGASLGMTHVSNLYRLSSSQPQNNDLVTTASVLAGLDQRFGRQRLSGDVTLRNNRYRNNGGLNNSAYSLDLGLDWAAADRLSGQVRLGANRNLAQFNPGDKPTTQLKNIQTSKQLDASARYGLQSTLSAELRAGYYSNEYSLTQIYRAYNYHHHYTGLGLVYRVREGLNFSLAARRTQGVYPEALFNPFAGAFLRDEVARNDIDLSSNWTISGASLIQTRLSSSRTRHSLSAQRDFDGVTGWLNWRWQATNKLQLNTSLSRNTGQETANGAVGSEFNRSSDNAQLSADYTLSGKLSFSASLSYAKRQLVNPDTGAPALYNNDQTTSFRLGANWSATRNSLLSCQYSHDKRSGEVTIYSVPYSANSIGCTAQLMLR